ncbi:hypothetical protein [Methanimicrococcus hongohii]|uniref:hypothetical protein n=1 Tax=Methanimicrococcus hongohii TaxID=3028295 RepID=UPI00292FC51E|nr:hypothetical protein [Methanimicrococcus sp. Hf6]
MADSFQKKQKLKTVSFFSCVKLLLKLPVCNCFYGHCCQSGFCFRFSAKFALQQQLPPPRASCSIYYFIFEPDRRFLIIFVFSKP